MIVSGHTDSFARDHLPPPEQWPDMVFDLPELRYGERMNCAAMLLDDMAAAGHAERPAIINYKGCWSYADLQRQVNRIAHVLRSDLQLAPGNRVLLRGANSPMMAACVLAIIKAGCIVVPTMPMLRTRELMPVIDKAQVNAVLCSFDLAEEIELARSQGSRFGPVLYFNADANASGSLEQRMAGKADHFTAVDTAADDVCIIGFTSGTTGVPKGTMHFHRDIIASRNRCCKRAPATCSSARPRWPSPSAWAACCSSRCGLGPRPCCWKS
jgi:2-aminobenzoate-CoA ligase